MDISTVILIAVVLVLVGFAFVLFRKKQRAGSILAAPNATATSNTPTNQSATSSVAGAPPAAPDQGEQR